MPENELSRNVDAATEALRSKLQGRTPEVAVVLGSGLNDVAERVEDPIAIPYEEIPHMRHSTAPGHCGRFVVGTLSGTCTVVMQGRLHGYEGYTSQEVVFPIWLLGKIGVKSIILSNAVGAINESYQVGDFNLVSDHINFTGRNPMADPAVGAIAKRYFSMTDAYDPKLRALALKVAKDNDIVAHEGVYLGLHGPTFETPAEIRAFRIWGADTVAMSMAEEAIAARQMGMRILGVNMVSNMAAGIGAVNGVGGADPNGQEVIDEGRKAAAKFATLVCGVIAEL